MYNGKKIGIAGCKHTTKDLIEGLISMGIIPDHVITISPEKAKEQSVAGYFDLPCYLAKQRIDFTIVQSYNLKKTSDQEKIEKLDIDLLLVMGWQRLIPDWFLEKLTIGAFGMHGSNKPLPHGRGRSPLNWSLIQGKKIFFTHLFQYLPGVDDGPIVGDQIFDITPYDDAHTLHLKNLLAMKKLCEKAIPALTTKTAQYREQPKEGVCYFPKRTAEDGIIFWNDSTIDIYNLIRAVTKPFPGAFSYVDNRKNKKITIWKAIPFDTHITWPCALPGEIIEVFYNGTFIVKTGDTSMLVLEYEYSQEETLKPGQILGTAEIERKKWDNLPN